VASHFSLPVATSFSRFSLTAHRQIPLRALSLSLCLSPPLSLTLCFTMFNYTHRCGTTEPIETAAKKKQSFGLLVSNVFHNGFKTDCCEIFASKHSGGRVRRFAHQAESTHNFTYCLSVQKSLCLVLSVVKSTEIRRQWHRVFFFFNRGIQTVGVQGCYFRRPRTMYMQLLTHVERKDRPKASTGCRKFSYDDARVILALERKFGESFVFKVSFIC